MEHVIGLLIFVAVISLLSGPIALIVSLIALSKVRQRSPEDAQKQTGYEPKQKPVEIKTIETPVELKPIEISAPPSFWKEEKQPELVKEVVSPEKAIAEDYREYVQQEKGQTTQQSGSWEQKIGTRWILIAGIITVFVGVAFFLKYYHDNFLRSPLQRVTTVAVFGFLTLIGGEITRRRGYGIVAKGVTALGFGLLYAAVFSGYQTYNLIGYIPACTLATIITIGAMIYAVALDEVLIAFLSLLGGFATPMIVLTKMNTPTPLFVYMLILGAGAMACAYYRKWKVVNLLAFAGTFILYSIWFYNSRFYSSRFASEIGDVHQIIFELSWLGVFFIFYLVMPVLFGLVNRIQSNKQDVLLILANAVITIYYLFAVLVDKYQHTLALCVFILAIIFLAFSAIVYKRCKDDAGLRISLHAIGIFCATLAVPLYFKLDAVTITWAFESAVLVFIGMRYKSILTQAAGLIVMGLSVGCLLINLPTHGKEFRFIFNPEFGTWVLVAAAIFVIHLLYRTKKEQSKIDYQVLTQLLFGLSMIVFFSACSLEWYYQSEYKSAPFEYPNGQLIIFTAFNLIFLPGFIKPKGVITEVLSRVLIAAGAVICLQAFKYFRVTSTAFINIDFAIVLSFLTSILIYQIRYRKISNICSQVLYIIFGLLFLAGTSFEWARYCGYSLPDDKLNRGYIIIWAVGVLLFVIRPIAPKGLASKITAFIFAIGGSAFTILNFSQMHGLNFPIFFNINFAIVLLFIIGLFSAAWFSSRDKEQLKENEIFKAVFSITAILMFLIVLTQEIYLYWDNKTINGEQVANWQFLAQMFISIAWAIYAVVLMLIGFWKNIRCLRYISLAIFACLLFKVFLIDTREIKNIYRVAAFLVTGITLVGVSYLYQFLKNKGFFDSLFIKDSSTTDGKYKN
jgi:uncharacterized membrane protein